MNKTLRRVRKYLVKLGRTLKNKRINQYIGIIIFTLVFIPVLTTESKTEDSKSLYKISFDRSGNVLKTNSVIDIKPSESVAQSEIRINKEKKLAEAKRLVLAREASTNRYQSQVVQPAPSGDVKHQLVLKAASAYNIPWEILEAVWQVESGKSWDTGRSSYAGASGPMQFMPGTWRSFGVDGDGDGKAIISDAEDAVYGGARYLAVNGADRNEIRNALYRYNHSTAYVTKVIGIAKSYGYNQ